MWNYLTYSSHVVVDRGGCESKQGSVNQGWQGIEAGSISGFSIKSLSFEPLGAPVVNYTHKP